MQEARRKKAIGGMIVGIKKELVQGEREEEIIEGRIKYGKEKLRIVGVYVNGNMERILELLGR